MNRDWRFVVVILKRVKSFKVLSTCCLCGVLLMGCTTQAIPTSQPIVAVVVQSPATTTPEPKPTEVLATQTTVKEFLPQAVSVWNTTIGPDAMTGNCKSSVLPVYGLVQVTPKGSDGNAIEWKNQEPKPYMLNKVKPNEYVYSGPTSINDGLVMMTVTIVDDKSLKMQREFVSSKELGCTHKHDYTGEFKWTR